MQQEVRLDLVTYDALQHSIQSKTERINALERELAKVKEDHEAEIEKLTKQGKVRCIGIKRHPFIPLLVSGEKEYKGFDDVKQEVYEHFKQGIFKEELEKQKHEQMESVFKQLQDKEETISGLKAEIERLKCRTLLERIRNK